MKRKRKEKKTSHADWSFSKWIIYIQQILMTFNVIKQAITKFL